MRSRFDLSRALAVIDLVTLPLVADMERPRRCHRYAIGAADIKEDGAYPRARDHHKLSRAVGLASSRVAASPRRGSERDASVAIYLPSPLLISRDVPPTRRSPRRPRIDGSPKLFSYNLFRNLCSYIYNQSRRARAF